MADVLADGHQGLDPAMPLLDLPCLALDLASLTFLRLGEALAGVVAVVRLTRASTLGHGSKPPAGPSLPQSCHGRC